MRWAADHSVAHFDFRTPSVAALRWTGLQTRRALHFEWGIMLIGHRGPFAQRT